MIAPLESSVWQGWGSVIVVSIVVVLVGAVVIVGAWQGIKSANVKDIARETVARDEAYHKLAEESTSLQQRTAQQLTRMSDALDAVQTKVDAIERMMREVA
jgi:hypothetical protein